MVGDPIPQSRGRLCLLARQPPLGKGALFTLYVYRNVSVFAPSQTAPLAYEGAGCGLLEGRRHFCAVGGGIGAYCSLDTTSEESLTAPLRGK